MALRTIAKKSAAYLAWRRGTMQRSRAASHDSARVAPGAARPLTMLGGRGLHHHHSSLAASSRRSGQGRQEFDLQASSILPMRLLALLFSRALGKASRAQQPHKTHRLISPPLWDAPPTGGGWHPSIVLQPHRPLHRLHRPAAACMHSLACGHSSSSLPAAQQPCRPNRAVHWIWPPSASLQPVSRATSSLRAPARPGRCGPFPPGRDRHEMQQPILGLDIGPHN
jgi:hypothetical protein